MFVVRYLVVAVAMVCGIVVWGLIGGLGLWQIAGIAGAAVLALQAAVLAYIAVLALRNGSRRPPRPDLSAAAIAQSGQAPSYLAVLPR